MKIDFTTKELEFYKKECNFNEENGELEVLELRNKGKSIVSIAIELNMDQRTVNRRIKNIKNKISKVKNI